MKAFLQSVLLCLSGQVYNSLAKSGQCHPPQLDNGVVEAEEGDAGNFFKGEFRCNPGFTLSGPTMLKCRNGVWSGNKPVCSVSGCDPKNLPNFVNGRRLRVKGTRDSVFKYKCNRGFRLFGPKNVYCTKSGWKMDEIPVCARFGCNEDELLGNGIPHGRKRSMFQGAVYRFYCESGSMMEGNSAVYCDGYSWNGTKPECLVPPTTPELSIELDGIEASEPLASVGQQLKLVCKAQGGNPFPTLAFMVNGERVEADNKEMQEYGYNAVHTFTVEDHHANLDMSCIAENRMTSIPVASNHQRLSVKFGPSNTYIHGADMVMPDVEVDYSCTSDESNPASDITVQITDQDGNDIAIEVTKPPKMKGNAGFASAMQFKFQVLPHFKSIFMKCDAANEVGQASTGLAVHVMYPLSNIQITGPDYLLSNGDESEPNNIFTCSTDESNPAAYIEWVIESDGGVETIPEHSTAVETINQGLGWKKISTLSLPTQDTEGVKVHCIATIGDLGFRMKSDELVVDRLELPREVSIVGPAFIPLNSVTEFECISQEGDNESLVSIHVTSLNGEPVSFLMESDNKISVTVQEPLEGIIVECFAENLAGVGPVQAKRVDIHYPPEVQIEGPEQLRPSTMLTYTCSTTNSQQKARLAWTVNDQDGHSVAFTELETGDLTSVIELYAGEGYDQLVVGCLATNEAGEGYAEVVAHTVESPKTVQMTAPDHIEAGSELTYECVSPLSSPQQSIRWEVTDWQGEVSQFETGDLKVLDGYVTSLLFVTAQPSARVLNVKCVASNYVGYVEDVSQEYLSYGAEAVHLTGPSSVLASEQAVFSCSSDMSYPAPSLMWSLDGQDVTRDAQQTNNVENEGGITSTSVLKLEPTMGGHEHVVECSVDGSDVSKKFKLTVEELYGEELYADRDYEEDRNEEGREKEYNYEEEIYSYDEEEYHQEGDNYDADAKYDIKETPEAFEHEKYEDNKEYNDKEDGYDYEEDEYNNEDEDHDFKNENEEFTQNQDDSDKADTQYESTEAATATEQNQYENEKEYSYKEEDYNYADEDYSEDENEEYGGEEPDYDHDYKNENKEYPQEQFDYNKDDTQYESTESGTATEPSTYENERENSNKEEDYNYEVENDTEDETVKYDGDESYGYEEHYRHEDDADDEDKEYSQTESEDAVSSENPEYDEDNKAEDATDSQGAKAVSEELFDATQQKQSFSAAEPGSAVLSHESDSNKHVSADLFSSKPLYSSSEKLWSVNIFISVFMCGISRLLS